MDLIKRFLLSCRPDRLCEYPVPLQWVTDDHSVGGGAKWPRSEADSTPQLIPKDKNVWSLTYSNPTCLHGVVLQ